ncbi:MAG: L,D-transpeptidase family protein, partial [Algiphilus sp.]
LSVALAVGSTVAEARLVTPPLLLESADVSAPGDPEDRLIEAALAFENGEARRALDQVDALIEDEPTFRAAHYLRGRIFGALAGAPASSLLPEHGEALEALSEELALRLARSALDEARHMQPTAVLALPDHLRYLLAVDLSAARLYVLENGPEGLRLIADRYAAMGSAGFGKEREGDNRTPLGIYRITEWKDDASLPELYGHGAYPVDYPNDWDRHRRRTGYGIWLHGVPRDTYARVPRSSEGCVTLSNDAMAWLQDYIDIGETRVVLAESLQWATREAVASERARFKARIDAWRSAWAQRDTEGYLNFYADNFTTEHRARAHFAAHKRAVNAGKSWIEVELREVAIFDYPGEAGLRLVSFEQEYRSDNYQSISHKHQYWRLQDDGSWKIEREVELQEREIEPTAISAEARP